MTNLLVTGLVLALPIAAVAEAPPTLIVAPLRVIDTEINAGAILTEQLRALLGRSASFTLVTPEEMEALDEELTRQLSGGCLESSCIAEVGGALGARYLVAGSLGLLGKTYVLNLKLIDIETTSAKATARPLMAPDLDGILKGMEVAVGDLTGGAPTAVAAPAAAPVTTVGLRENGSPSTSPKSGKLTGNQIIGIVAIGVTAFVMISYFMFNAVFDGFGDSATQAPRGTAAQGDEPDPQG